VKLDRRQLLKASGVSALAALASPLARSAEARGLLTDPLLEKVVEAALSAAAKAGASYADVRVVRRRDEGISTRDAHVSGVSATESYGLGVRVLAEGAWGFSATSRVEPSEAARVAGVAVGIARANSRGVKHKVELAPEPSHVDLWRTPLVKDPFRIPPGDKARLLIDASVEALKVPGVKYCDGRCQTLGEWKLFASSEGSWIEQDLTRIAAGYDVTAVDAASGRFATRAMQWPARQAGWEHVEEAPFSSEARRIGEEAVEKLRAPRVQPGKLDVILTPSNLWLTIHESVGHPTELDRALGYEANFAGTSFATIEKLGKLQYAAPLVSLYGDKTTPGGLATCAYDDDGVRTQRFDLIKNGLFVGYQTNREQARWVGEKRSRGTNYAMNHRSYPFQRMPNVSLEPGKKSLRLEDLIAATDRGVLIEGRGSWSIDQQRYNFQFGGQTFHWIENGRKKHALRDVAYQASTVEFWNSCDLLGGPDSWELFGSLGDGKGEPGQASAVSHGCPPARFRGVNVLDVGEKEAGA